MIYLKAGEKIGPVDDGGGSEVLVEEGDELKISELNGDENRPILAVYGSETDGISNPF
jgi:hypothetical protein